MSTVTPEAAQAPARRRGRENVRDMLLSMAVCVAVIVPIWFLGQPAPSDSRPIRVVDTAADLQAFAQAAPGVPVPGTLPEGWRPTSSNLDGDRLRIGYVTPDDGYVEYAGKADPTGDFVAEQTGQGQAGGSLSVGPYQARVYSDGEHTSLVIEADGGTVVLGGLREAAEDDEITALAALLR